MVPQHGNNDPTRSAPVQPGPMRWPAWMDSLFMARASDAQFQTLTVSGNDAQVVVPANPSRWALVFEFPAAVPLGALLAAHPDEPNLATCFITASLIVQFDIFRYGPIVSREWYARNANTLTFGYWEIVIR